VLGCGICIVRTWVADFYRKSGGVIASRTRDLLSAPQRLRKLVIEWLVLYYLLDNIRIIYVHI
jgi:hypothetical protein